MQHLSGLLKHVAMTTITVFSRWDGSRRLHQRFCCVFFPNFIGQFIKNSTKTSYSATIWIWIFQIFNRGQGQGKKVSRNTYIVCLKCDWHMDDQRKVSICVSPLVQVTKIKKKKKIDHAVIIVIHIRVFEQNINNSR